MNLRLKPRHALPIYSRHPWVFATSLQNYADGSATMPGLEVVVESDGGEPIARGLVNPHSLLRVRLYSWDLSQELNAEFFAARIAAAIERRRVLLGDIRSCRLIFSEADELSGLTVDAYDGYLLVQLTSAALASRIESLLDALNEQLSPPGIWLRVEREIAEKENIDPVDRLARGDAPPRPLIIEQPAGDATVQFAVDLIGGQKTGFYYDQRENRSAVARYCRGAGVFDGHCYTGGYALTIARCGDPSSVVAVDSSEGAIRLAKMNAELNDLHRSGQRGSVEFVQDDVSDRLKADAAANRTYGVVIIDPPKLARSRKGVNRATKAYVRLNMAAVAAVVDNGILVTHSCSGLIDDARFDQILQTVALESGRSIHILERRSAGVDHPTRVTCNETDYLTCRICLIGPRPEARDPEVHSAVAVDRSEEA